MKNLLFCILICVTFAVGAQNYTSNTIEKKGFLEFGPSALLLQPSDGDMRSFFGIGISGGGYVTKYSYVGIEANLNFLISKGEEVGTYEYQSPTFYNVVNRGTVAKTFNVFPILGTWALSLDFSEKVRFNVGPVLGTTIFHSYHDFIEHPPTSSNLPELGEGVVYMGGDYPDLPKITKATFNYGGEASFLFRLRDGMSGDTYLGVRYKYIRNTGPTFEEGNMAGTMHQIKLMLNYTW
jgi:hypothetical protein